MTQARLHTVIKEYADASLKFGRVLETCQDRAVVRKARTRVATTQIIVCLAIEELRLEQ